MTNQYRLQVQNKYRIPLTSVFCLAFNLCVKFFISSFFIQISCSSFLILSVLSSFSFFSCPSSCSFSFFSFESSFSFPLPSPLGETVPSRLLEGSGEELGEVGMGFVVATFVVFVLRLSLRCNSFIFV